MKDVQERIAEIRSEMIARRWNVAAYLAEMLQMEIEDKLRSENNSVVNSRNVVIRIG